MKKIYAIGAMLILSSCSGLLEENPETFIAPENFYSNLEEATSATYGVYDMLPPMYRNPYMTSFADVSSNSFKVTSASATDFQPFDIHSVSPSNYLLTDFWEYSYRAINRANAIIDRMPATQASEASKDELVGEVKFLRALYYFNLVRLFGDVPLTLEETLSLDNLKLGRTPALKIYETIISDLEDAKSKLPLTPRQEGRANAYAANALLARVYLHLKNFPKAAAEANVVVQSGKYALWASYREAFLEKNDNGKESVFAVQYRKDVDGLNLNSWALSPLLNKYADGNFLDLMEVTDELLNSYEPGDERKSLNAVSEYVTAGGETITFQALCFKYADGIFKDKEPAYNLPGNSGVNYQILRYADVLLMFAEAENENAGPTADAYEAINKVRRRAFGVAIDSPSAYDLSGLDKNAFREAVWLERFRELPFEGQQWFDLIRTGRAESVLGISSERTVYPIPQRELDVNSELVQNDGYN